VKARGTKIQDIQLEDGNASAIEDAVEDSFSEPPRLRTVE